MKVYVVNTVMHHEEVGMFIPVFESMETAISVAKETGSQITEDDLVTNAQLEDELNDGL